ncbi:MAG: hypothetical protein JNL57_00065 [Bacteroidetes bacterium]|nr:hypothetical protein [Bacteroidota bacterium]
MVKLFGIFISMVFIASCGIRENRGLSRLEKRQRDTMKNPYWIGMMDDTATIYAAAVSAFDLYWKNREKPVRDEDNEGQDLFSGDKDKTPENKPPANLDLVYDYKRFLHWKQTNQYKLKEDGRVMTAWDILQQWKKEHSDTAR